METARRLGLPGLLVMALVRAGEAAAVAGDSSGSQVAEALRLLRRQGTRRWVPTALTVATLTQDGRTP